MANRLYTADKQKDMNAEVQILKAFGYSDKKKKKAKKTYFCCKPKDQDGKFKDKEDEYEPVKVPHCLPL